MSPSVSAEDRLRATLKIFDVKLNIDKIIAAWKDETTVFNIPATVKKLKVLNTSYDADKAREVTRQENSAARLSDPVRVSAETALMADSS